MLTRCKKSWEGTPEEERLEVTSESDWTFETSSSESAGAIIVNCQLNENEMQTMGMQYNEQISTNVIYYKLRNLLASVAYAAA